MKKTLATLFCLLSMTLMTSCGADAAASAAGVYEVDKAGLKDLMLAEMPEAARTTPQAAEMMKTMLDGMNFSIELKADGTCASKGEMSMMGNVTKFASAGTWKLDGDKLVTVMKEEGSDKEETTEVPFKNGVLTMEKDMGGKKMKMTFKKKS